MSSNAAPLSSPPAMTRMDSAFASPISTANSFVATSPTTTHPTRADNETSWRNSIKDTTPEILDGIAEEIEIKLNQLVNAHLSHQGNDDNQTFLDGLRAIRRICQAWTNYPGINGFIGTVEICDMDYSKTAFEVVKPAVPKVSIHWLIAQVMSCKIIEASLMDSLDVDTVLNDVVRGACRTYLTWYTVAEDLGALDLAAFEDEEMPDTYTYSCMISTETAEKLFKQQKKQSGKRKKSIVSSSPLTSPPADLDDGSVKIYTPGKLAKTASGISSKRGADKKRKAEDDAADSSPQHVDQKKRKIAKGKSRLSKAVVIEESADDDEQGPSEAAKKPRKQRKTLDHDQQAWLRDEHDLLFQLVLDHKDWDLHEIYVFFNTILSGTAYRSEGSKWPEDFCKYRTTFVPYPTDGMTKAQAREKDQGWRSFASVRNRTQWFLTVVRKWRRSDKSKEWMKPQWDMCAINEAATWRKEDGTPAPPVTEGQYAVYTTTNLPDYYLLCEVAEDIENLRAQGRVPVYVPQPAAPGDDVEDYEAFVMAQEEDDVLDTDAEDGDTQDNHDHKDSLLTSDAALASELQAEYDAEAEAIATATAADAGFEDREHAGSEQLKAGASDNGNVGKV